MFYISRKYSENVVFIINCSKEELLYLYKEIICDQEASKISSVSIHQQGKSSVCGVSYFPRPKSEAQPDIGRGMKNTTKELNWPQKLFYSNK